MRKLTIEEFKEKARKIHGDKYNYDKTVYINDKIKVIITCQEHGDFEQRPNGHLHGRGCPKCANQRRAVSLVSNIEEFKKKAREIHGDKYNYDKTVYVNSTTRVVITCREHGDFEQIPSTHLQGHGCPLCGIDRKAEKLISNLEEFKKKAREIHGDKYNYDKTVYVNSRSNVIITCPKHGDFKQPPGAHLYGKGCPLCGIASGAQKQALTTEEFKRKARKIHGDKYNYDKTVYINNKSSVIITCLKHGDFKQRPDTHLQGHGCPKCNSSKLEDEIRKLLTENGIRFEEQKPFPWLIGPGGGPQTLDFYLPDLGIGIECQGGQHFYAIDIFGGEEGFKNAQERDQNKLKLCEEHGIKLMYYSNLSTPDKPFDYPYPVYEDGAKLIEKLMSMLDNDTDAEDTAQN